ncbi:MAG: hypothetical protein ABMA13_22505 [Chthoniobacteraceae bacterium]
MPLTADEAFDRLEQSRTRGRFAQAYLITGAPGAGKRRLLDRLAGALLGGAEKPLDHADVHAIEPQMKSRQIGIEAVRELNGQLQLSSRHGGAKLAILHDADRMTTEAANALLRTLEEPPPGTYFFLLSSEPDRLLETIISRCIEVPLRLVEKPALTAREQSLLDALRAAPPGSDLAGVFGLVRQFTELLVEARAEIDEQNEAAFKKEETALKQVGARKDAIEEREDFFKALTESRYRVERDRLLAIVEQWFADALRQQHGAPEVDHPAFREATSALAAKLSTAELLRRAAALVELRDHFGRSVQEQLAIECAFLKAFGATTA